MCQNIKREHIEDLKLEKNVAAGVQTLTAIIIFITINEQVRDFA